jgi:spore cortex biosynthesis protein YabQ
MAVMTGCGIYLGAALDTFRRLSVHWKGKVFAGYFLEVSFWLLQALLIFYCLFLVNSGEIRLYIFLACFLGFSFYQALLKKGYLRILEGILSVLRSIFRFLKKTVEVLIVWPLKGIFLVCTAVVMFLFQMVVKIVEIMLTVILFPFRLLGRLIKPILPENIIRFLHKIAAFYSTIRTRLKKALEHVSFKRR